jgi:hypothetical protein
VLILPRITDKQHELDPGSRHVAQREPQLHLSEVENLIDDPESERGGPWAIDRRNLADRHMAKARDITFAAPVSR